MSADMLDSALPRSSSSLIDAEPLKILMVNKYYPPKIGGIEFHVADLSEALVAAGHEVRVLVCNTEKTFSREVRNGVEVIRLPRLTEFASTPISFEFRAALEEHARWADLLHFHFPYPFGEFEWLSTQAFKQGKAYIVTYHTDIVRQKTALKLYQPFMTRFLDSASALIASSPNLIKHSAQLSKRKERAHHINFGLKVEEIAFNKEALDKAPTIRAQMGNKPFVLFVGRLVYYKGVDVLTQSMRENDLDYVVVGSGPLKAEIEKIAAENGTSERLHIFENLSYPDLIAWLHAADVLALPSVLPSEAFGLVQIEAHAARTPTVSTNLKSGVPYANLDGITGIVIEVGDSKALGQALARITSDRKLHDELASQAQARALADFNIEQMLKKTLALYREVFQASK